MMGKTHVVGSLVLAHAALYAYVRHENPVDAGVTHTLDNPPVEIFGLPLGVPMGLLEYSLTMTVVLLFVLLLLRVGSGKFWLGYLVGIAALLAVLFFAGGDSLSYGFEMSLLLIVFALGALFPDIDSETSTLGRYVPVISENIPHRTITHTIWPVLLLGVGVWYFESIYLLVFTIGYVLHIAEDSFSRQGIAWFYPLLGGYSTFGGGGAMKDGRKPGIFAYRAGGTAEAIMFYGAIALHAGIFGFVVWQSIF